MKNKIFKTIFVLIGVLLIYHFSNSRTSYVYDPVSLPETFEEFYNNQLLKSKELNARRGNEEKLITYAEKTDAAILYIHGFGASRAEGEYILDMISKKFKYNVYYMRLPGHGTNIEDHANTTMKQHLDEAINTLFMMEKLGKKTIVVGTSMGGLLATYLAAEYPDKIDSLILTSPFYEFAPLNGKMLRFYPLFKLVSMLMPERIVADPVPDEVDNWTLYWYKDQYTRALKQIIDLSNFVNDDDVLEKVKVPVLLMYYYRDEEHQDTIASVKDMQEAYTLLNYGIPHVQSREISIEKGAHVLMSKYEKIDYNTVEQGITKFIEDQHN